MFTVSIPQLTLHIPRESLPHRLGGTLEIQHEAWLLHCLKSMTNRGGGELCEVSIHSCDVGSSSYIVQSLYLTLKENILETMINYKRDFYIKKII